MLDPTTLQSGSRNGEGYDYVELKRMLGHNLRVTYLTYTEQNDGVEFIPAWPRGLCVYHVYTLALKDKFQPLACRWYFLRHFHNTQCNERDSKAVRENVFFFRHTAPTGVNHRNFNAFRSHTQHCSYEINRCI